MFNIAQCISNVHSLFPSNSLSLSLSLCECVTLSLYQSFTLILLLNLILYILFSFSHQNALILQLSVSFQPCYGFISDPNPCLTDICRMITDLPQTYKPQNTEFRQSVVLLSDGNSEIGAHIRTSELLFDSFKVFDQIDSSHTPFFFLRKDLFSCRRAQHVLSYHVI